MALDTETKTALDGALRAFDEHKSLIANLDTDLKTMQVKVSSFDKAMFDRIADDVAKGVEAAQKMQAAQKALDDHNKALEKEVDSLKAAFNRVSVGDGKESEEKTREVQKKLFNDFAR